MHDGQLDIDERAVRALIAEQFPQWRDEPVRHLDAGGTVNAIFRIGERYAARFRLTSADPASVGTELAAEAAAMEELASVCPVPTPLPVAVGAPGAGYPVPWAVQTWVAGRTATPTGLARSTAFALCLVEMIGALREAGTGGRSERRRPGSPPAAPGLRAA